MSSNRLSILHVVGWLAPRYGGPPAAVTAMCDGLRARGHLVEIVTTNVDGTTELPVAVGRRVNLDAVPTTYHAVMWPRFYLPSPGLATDLWRRARDFDVIHIHGVYPFHVLAASVVCQRRRVPYVLRPHGSLDSYHRRHHSLRKSIYHPLARHIISRASAVHYTSEAERRDAEEFGVTAPAAVIPNPIELPATAAQGRVRQTADERTREQIVTFLGRLTTKKGVDLLIRALPAITRKFPTCRLVIAGPDDEGWGARLARLAESLGVAERISLVGTVVGPEKAALLRQSDVFVLPSADESFGMAVAEAMAYSVPVVVTRGIAIHSKIASERAGLVVERNPEALAAAICSLLETPDEARLTGQRGRSLVETNYGKDIVAAQLESLYEQVLHLPSL